MSNMKPASKHQLYWIMSDVKNRLLLLQ